MSIVRRVFVVGIVASLLAGCGAPSAPSRTEQNNVFATIEADLNKDVRVTYRVLGSARQADVTYATATGAIEQKTVTLPWTLELKAPKSGQFLSVSAQEKSGLASATITCQIARNGTTIQHADSSGAYHIASCSTSAP